MDRNCQKCEIEEETQQHLLDCRALSDSSLVVGSPSRYQDLFRFRAEPSTIGNICQEIVELARSRKLTKMKSNGKENVALTLISS